MARNILFIISSARAIGPNGRVAGYAFPEVAWPHDEFVRRGHAVDFATPAGGAPTITDYDEKDASSRAFRESKAFLRLQNSRKLAEIDPAAYDAIFFPGGLGPMADLATDPVVKRTIVSTFEGGRVVSAVCHGPAALLGATLSSGRPFVSGRRLTSFTNEEETHYGKDDVPFLLADALVAEGAVRTQAPLFAEHVVVDGRLVTGQNPASSAGVARAVLEALGEPLTRAA